MTPSRGVGGKPVTQSGLCVPATGSAESGVVCCVIRSEEPDVPIYEYHCEKCKKDFAETMRLEDYGRKQVKCVYCQSKQVRRLMGSVSVKTSKKS